MKSYINGFGREKSFGNGQGRGQETHRMQVPGTVISGDKCSQLKGCVKPGMAMPRLVEMACVPDGADL